MLKSQRHAIPDGNGTWIFHVTLASIKVLASQLISRKDADPVEGRGGPRIRDSNVSWLNRPAGLINVLCVFQVNFLRALPEALDFRIVQTPIALPCAIADNEGHTKIVERKLLSG
jgi:hypothetical protein